MACTVWLSVYNRYHVRSNTSVSVSRYYYFQKLLMPISRRHSERTDALTALHLGVGVQ
jgi:hypothetical protein